MSGLAEVEARLGALMLAALDGDAAAYRALLKEADALLRRYYGRRLFGVAANAADDLVQETLMAVHARRLTFDREQRFTAWLYAIAHYKLVDYFRRAKIRQTVPIGDDDQFFAPDETEAATAKRDVDALLETIPAKPAELIRQVKLEGATVSEAAARVGMTETAAKVSIHRGLKALAARMTGGAANDR
jgi:RNA polymerase sigma-70 factor (ECF subfamily)